MNTYIADLLEEIRGQTKWPEVRIAQEAGVSQPTINRIRNGQPDCKGKTIVRITELHKRVMGNSST